MKTFPTPEALRRFPFGLADIAVILGTLVLLSLVARVGAGTLVSFHPPDIVPRIDLSPWHLPYYAACSTLRMFIALFCSTVFTLAYGYIAANSRRAERVMIPLLDILQSVPVLGFLSITVTGFIALFPGSLLGLEAASIFAIFTSQVWNMAFSFYQSLRTIPKELDEAATLYQLSRWQRFTKLEIPAATIGLLWNAMMSFGGGWFFVAASEAISVLNQDYTLPGIGSYVAAAIASENLAVLGWALLTIAIVILLVDQLFWRPLIAWSNKFRMEQSASADAPASWVYDLLKAARIPRLVGNALNPATEAINRVLSALTQPKPDVDTNRERQQVGDRLYNLVLWAVIGLLVAAALHFILTTVGLGEVFKAFGLGVLTLLRVTVLLLFATVIWTPIGVAIGFNPKLARALQPAVQFLASFPANFIFPFATLFFIRTHISIEWGSILLMALGAQWYILFNSIAGAQSIPTDLREMSKD
ncbi:MAG TPA: ABC transporter permease subunit, partial [Chroococcidiopsis sp.]